MKYSKEEVLEFVREEDVKFVRLAFCDVFGALKNIAIMADELQRAFDYGVSFDASSIAGFGDQRRSDLFLMPEPDTLTILPWRPEHGRVVRMFCEVRRPDGTPFEADSRYLLKKAVADAQKLGCRFYFGSEQEFYLFELDERGKPTKIPYDDAGYMDVYPADKGENVRREICLTLEQMGFRPESSHHEQGPGQNEIDFRFADPLTTADNTISFQFVAKAVARRNGLFADLSAKPLEKKPGNGFHINLSVDAPNVPDAFERALAGILAKIEDVTAFLNPTEDSYKRLGQNQAPRYVSWGRENRSQLVRIPAASCEFKRMELRSPDPTANPY
ncbi:MAG: glutamine synthetase, partial [Thermoguttaceae bacterium]|nr:glutamine synthetase [Thermoguttaceae bacterium]